MKLRVVLNRAGASRSFGTIVWIALFLLLAFSFLGTRPIWDPDEGRYTNVALNMLERGDWLHPMRSEEAGHWSKPPLTYWAIAGSVAALGYTPWAARLPVALAFLACTFVCGRLARRLAPGRERMASLVFATMALPLCAATLVTTDFLLAAMLALAMWGYVEVRFGDATHASRWRLLLWAGLGLAFLTKGPPALLPVLAIVVFEWLSPSRDRAHIVSTLGIVLFVLIAFGWFAWVSWQQPSLLGYFLGNEVAQRIAGDGFGRNAQWYGWLLVYGPTLLLGSLPWTARWWRGLCAVPAMWTQWRAGPASHAIASDVLAHRAAEARIFTLLWLALPLLVLCIAHSRLPLYALPLFVPIALAVAQTDPTPPRWHWLAGWIVVLLALRVAVAMWPTHKDAASWAEAIRARAPETVHEVVFVDDMARYGIHLHLQAEVEKLALDAPVSEAPGREFDHGFLGELQEREAGLVYVTPDARFAALALAAATVGKRLQRHGTPFQGRVIFTAHDDPAPVADMGVPPH